MKRVYAEMFTPNEYVTACGDSGKTINLLVMQVIF